MIFWRGLGILVFVIFCLGAWIMSYYYADTRLGNGAYMGWSMLCSVVPTLLLYLALRKYNLKEKELAPGEIPVEKSKIFTGHSFFFIPVVFWAPIFLVVGLILINGSSSDSSNQQVAEDREVEVSEDDQVRGEQVVNFWNPNDDTTAITTYYKDGSERMHEVIPPKYIRYATYDAGIYGFEYAGYKKQITIHGAADLDTNSYNQAWFLLDPKIDLLLVEVSEACDKAVTEKELRAIDWTLRVEKRYEGGQLMQPVLDASETEKHYTVIDPGWPLPLEIGKNQVVYALIPIEGSEKTTDEFLDERIVKLCF